MPTYADRAAARQARLERAADRFVAACRARDDVRAVYAFGSLGRGDVGPRSDLDLLVVRETAKRGVERGVDLAIAADVGVELDLVVVTPEEFREQLPSSRFGSSILADARCLYAA
jgi:predicted nucleotidyltransferase